MTDSQTAIGTATGDAAAKLKATAAEWVKIESTAPTTIKPSVVIVRTAYKNAGQSRHERCDQGRRRHRCGNEDHHVRVG